MSAAVSPPLVQLGFGFGNLTRASTVSYGGLERRGATEDIEMFARKSVFSRIGRTALMASGAAVALTVVEPSLALAGPAPSGKGLSAATSGTTDISARRRFYRGGGGAA